MSGGCFAALVPFYLVYVQIRTDRFHNFTNKIVRHIRDDLRVLAGYWDAPMITYLMHHVDALMDDYPHTVVAEDQDKPTSTIVLRYAGPTVIIPCSVKCLEISALGEMLEILLRVQNQNFMTGEEIK